MSSRHSIKRSLAAVRAARTLTGQSEVRYCRQHLVAKLLREALGMLNVIKAKLLRARTMAAAKRREAA